MAKDKISGKKFDKEMKRLPRGPNTPDELSFKHSVPELF